MRLRGRWLLVGMAGLVLTLPWLVWGGYAALALLRREHFYHALPSSHWATAVARWDRVSSLPAQGSSAWHEAWLVYLGLGGEPAVLKGDPEAVPVLADLVRTGQERVRCRAAWALGSSGPVAEEAVSVLVEALADTSPHVRAHAARALGDLRVLASSPFLINLLGREADGGVIQQTVLALTALRAVEAVPTMKACAKHEDVQTRAWVVQAIGSLGGKREVGFLAAYLNDPSISVQWQAAEAMEAITGADFGLPKEEGPVNPNEGIAQARAWWRQHQGDFPGR
jgi:hypothetical protein